MVEQSQEKSKAMILHKYCSATAKTLGCYQHCYGRRSKMQHHTGCYEENQLHPSQTQQTHSEVNARNFCCSLVQMPQVVPPRTTQHDL